MFRTLLASLLFVVSAAKLVHLTEDTWEQCLMGEWMIEFYAPWCPACHELKKAWDALAKWSEEKDIHVAEVDVTENPGLSGRFLVTALPSIYHVKDGQFRLYGGPRDKKDFVDFLMDKKWTVVDEVPGWRYPTSFQMGIVSGFFKMSMKVRDAHNFMVQEKGIPAWGSYLVFGLATLILGSVLGFIIVCIIDYIFPPAPKQPKKQSSDKKQKDKKKESEKSKTSDDESVRKRTAAANGDAKPAASPKSKDKDSSSKKKK